MGLQVTPKLQSSPAATPKFGQFGKEDGPPNPADDPRLRELLDRKTTETGSGLLLPEPPNTAEELDPSLEGALEKSLDQFDGDPRIKAYLAKPVKLSDMQQGFELNDADVTALTRKAALTAYLAQAKAALSALEQ